MHASYTAKHIYSYIAIEMTPLENEDIDTACFRFHALHA